MPGNPTEPGVGAENCVTTPHQRLRGWPDLTIMINIPSSMIVGCGPRHRR
jgi:hypothetical protein